MIIFGCSWNLKISSYRVILSLEGFWFLLEDFLEDYISAW
jgi:hypothetical protein